MVCRERNTRHRGRGACERISLKLSSLVTLLIDQVAGKDNQVCFLLIHQIDQLPNGFRISLPPAYMYVR